MTKPIEELNFKMIKMSPQKYFVYYSLGTLHPNQRLGPFKYLRDTRLAMATVINQHLSHAE